MNLMLAVIVTCSAVGLLSPHFGRRTYLLLAGIAAAMVGFYFAFPQRFM